MEGEEIGLVLARASELRAKISDCIDGSGSDACGLIAVEDEREDESDGLVAIRSALDSLEQQLAALQIDRSRVIMLGKLKEYRGEKLEVINEVVAFASEAVEHDDGLILPPYPIHLPDLFTQDDIGGSSHIMVKKSSSINGHVTINKNEDNATEYDTHKNHRNETSNGIGHIIGLVVKSAMTFVSIVSILGLAGYNPMIKKRSKGMLMSGAESPMDSQVSIQCPKGKFLVIEDGKARCVVKERIEVPFEPDVTSPSISYGFG